MTSSRSLQYPLTGQSLASSWARCQGDSKGSVSINFSIKRSWRMLQVSVRLSTQLDTLNGEASCLRNPTQLVSDLPWANAAGSL